jgi:hypothetical protein
VSKYKLIKHRPFTSKTVAKAVVEVPVKQKTSQVAKKEKNSPPTKSKDRSKKVTFVPEDVRMCLSDLAKHYSVNTSMPSFLFSKLQVNAL